LQDLQDLSLIIQVFKQEKLHVLIVAGLVTHYLDIDVLLEGQLETWLLLCFQEQAFRCIFVIVFRHGYGPVILIVLLPELDVLLLVWLALLPIMLDLAFIVLKFSQTLFALVEDGLLGLQDWSSLLEGRDYVDVFAYLALLEQAKQPLVELVGLYRISLVKGVQPCLLRHDVRLPLGELGTDERLLPHRPPPFVHHQLGRLQVFEGIA
jgi:hypothetical protein